MSCANKPTVAAPPGHQPKSDPEKRQTVSNYFAEWCGSIIFMCIAVLTVAGTYKLMLMMFN